VGFGGFAEKYEILRRNIRQFIEKEITPYAKEWKKGEMGKIYPQEDGKSRLLLDTTVQYTKNRHFGRSITKFQVNRHEFVDMATHITVAIHGKALCL